MWATELGSVLGIFFAASQSFYEISLYPTYRYLFILFVIALHLQQWTNYRRLYKAFTKRWFWPLTIVFMLFAYMLGSIDFIDYKRLNESVLSNNPYYKLDISKPQSSRWSKTKYYSTTRQLYLGLPKSNQLDNEYHLLYEGAKNVNLNSIDSIVTFWKSESSVKQHPGFRFQLNVDKSTPMSVVNLSLIHISEPTRRYAISYAVFCLKKKK